VKLDWDEVTFYVISILITLAIAWLLVVPAPGHAPLLTWHTVEVLA